MIPLRTSMCRFARAGLLVLALLATACTPGGKPLWATRLQPAPPAVSLDPKPPSQLVWIHAESAAIPDKAVGGEPWDDDDSGPDPFLVVIANDKEVLSFSSVADSFTPTWGSQPGGNIALDKLRSLRIELRDADGLNSQLIGSAKLTPDGMSGGLAARTIALRPRGRVKLAIEPAHALIGLGLDYRRYEGGVIITDTLSYGPADRVGIRPGDTFVKLAGKKVSGMRADEIKSIFNAVPIDGLEVVVLHKKEGTTETVTLVEGPIYALLSEYGPIH